MNYYLVKSEPGTWSWDQQVKEGRTYWDGVRNYQASNFMKEMKVGDLALFYHSGKDREVVGIVKVVKEYYPDHTDKSGRFGMVDLEVVKGFEKAVTLKEIKGEKSLSEILLVRNSRLSVMGLGEGEFKKICEMGGTKI